MCGPIGRIHGSVGSSTDSAAKIVPRRRDECQRSRRDRLMIAPPMQRNRQPDAATLSK